MNLLNKPGWSFVLGNRDGLYGPFANAYFYTNVVPANRQLVFITGQVGALNP
jgi:hypothetical protein